MILPTKLDNALTGSKLLVIALSGGIDSLTLSAAAALARNGQKLRLCHAVSPAVPEEATKRVKAFASERALALGIVDAGEFNNAEYRANPLNRCYHCKTHLYRALAGMGDLVAAGTNLDDLADYRPGLQAAEEHGVLHPFVTAGMRKSDIRDLARQLGLGDLAEMPASPCLASRIETGLRVEPADLAMIDAVETLLRADLGEITVRCRRTHEGFAIEIDQAIFTSLSSARLERLHAITRQHVDSLGAQHLPLSLRPYRMGSAFLHV